MTEKHNSDWLYAKPDVYERRFGALPLGEFHDHGKCALCGHPGEAGRTLYRTVLRSTNAGAMLCTDVMSCIRRRGGRRG